jgi:hypothetical protein
MTYRACIIGLVVLMLVPATGIAGAPEHAVRMVQACIPMPDGVMLAATPYMPANLRRSLRLPALLEYLPYRKDDDTAPGGCGRYAYVARHGCIGARVGKTTASRSCIKPTTSTWRSPPPWAGQRPWKSSGTGSSPIAATFP